MNDIAGAVVVLVTLLLIFGVIIFGVRRGTGSGLARTLPLGPQLDGAQAFGVTTFFGGLTMSVAIFLGFQNSLTATSAGISVGIVFGLLVVARGATAGEGTIVRTIKEVVQGIVGIVVVVPATARYFEVATAPGTLWPFWYSVAVYLILVIVILWALITSVVAAPAHGRFGVLLAFFSALSISMFFMQPARLGIGMEAVMAGPWWWVPFAGVGLVIVACLVGPQFVIAAAGVVLALTSLLTSAVFRDDDGILLTVLCYVAVFGVVWFLIGKLVFGAVLKAGR